MNELLKKWFQSTRRNKSLSVIFSAQCSMTMISIKVTSFAFQVYVTISSNNNKIVNIQEINMRKRFSVLFSNIFCSMRYNNYVYIIKTKMSFVIIMSYPCVCCQTIIFCNIQKISIKSSLEYNINNYFY